MTAKPRVYYTYSWDPNRTKDHKQRLVQLYGFREADACDEEGARPPRGKRVIMVMVLVLLIAELFLLIGHGD